MHSDILFLIRSFVNGILNLKCEFKLGPGRKMSLKGTAFETVYSKWQLGLSSLLKRFLYLLLIG